MFTCVLCTPTRRLLGGGINLSNLQPLEYVGRIQAQVPHSRLKMALLTADYFNDDLDFLFLTETWAKVEESTMFGELCPPDCCFISSRGVLGKVEV